MASLKLPLLFVPNGKSNVGKKRQNGFNPKAIVSRRNYYIQFIDAKHNVRNSIYVERRKHKDGTTTYLNRSFAVKRKVKAKTPRQLLDILGIDYEPQSIRLVRA
jgi:hypothetical protein